MPENSSSRAFHISLNVADINRAVDFYKKALGMEPTKHHPDYAKFELADPPVVLSLEPGRAASQDRLNHLGIRVPDGDALRHFAEKAHLGGLAPQYLQGVECCYSRQTKLCLNDPDGNLVEFYIVEEDLEKPATPAQVGKSETAATTASPATSIVWEHLLGTPFPERIPLETGTANEVRLRGTFNIKKSPKEALAILSEALRALSPEGELMIHLLVADREVTKKLPRLPGPAALVEHTPTETELLQLLEEAGFSGITLKRLSHSAVFQFDGCEMRELMLTAQPKDSAGQDKPPQWVVYKGPFREITDDHGVKYVRGTRTSVKGSVFSSLQTSRLAENFVFLNSTPPAACSVSAETSSPEASL